MGRGDRKTINTKQANRSRTASTEPQQKSTHAQEPKRAARELLFGRRPRLTEPRAPRSEMRIFDFSEEELHDLDTAALLNILDNLNQKADPPDQDFDQLNQLTTAANNIYDVHDGAELDGEIIDAIIDMQYAIDSNEPPC